LRALALGLIAASGFGVFVVDLAPEDFAGEHFPFCNAGAATRTAHTRSGRPSDGEGVSVTRCHASRSLPSHLRSRAVPDQAGPIFDLGTHLPTSN
jgi:hypothetical protein